MLQLLTDKQFHSFTVLTAFTSLGGIRGLSKPIEEAEHLDNITIITGVDQKVTSKEALEALLELEIQAYVFYQVESPIFHPKIYLFEGVTKSTLIIGSSNLTIKGLFLNVESSVLLEVDNRNEKEYAVILELKKYYESIFDKTDANLQKLSKSLIKKLLKNDIIPTEKEQKKQEDKIAKQKRKAMKKAIVPIFPNRKVPKIPTVFRKPKKQTKGTSSLSIKNKPSKLLWESNPLTQRDLNIPKNPNTNPTGSMLFKKGKSKTIDQRHHFRNVVFSSLVWIYDSMPRKKHIERSKAKFKIIINGKVAGDFELKLNHDTRTTTKTYLQNNSMTSISWGEAKSVIAKKELIGKTAKLYKNKGKSDQFILKIE